MAVNVNDLKTYVKVFSVKALEKQYEKQDAEEKAKIEKARQKLLERVEEIFELEPVKNRWTMYNSLNYIFNHDKGRTLDNRYGSIWFGDSRKLDQKALNIALTM